MLARVGYLMGSAALNATGGAAFSGLLDKITATATAAYSVRKIRGAYAGAAMNVRRSSDNVTQDIGFVGGDFDVASFNSFIGANNGFVATWYDQSGGARHATQATAASQPQLIVSGTPNGKPTLLAAANPGTTLLAATIPAGVVPMTFNAVCERTGNFSSVCLIASLGDSQPCMYFDGGQQRINIGNTSVDGLAGPAAADSAFHSSFAYENGASSNTTTDGTAGTAGPISTHTGSTALYLFAGNGAGNFGITGNISEAMYFPATVSGADMTTANSDQHTYYGF